MRTPKLALHRWTMGQVLMPAHFQAQERALLDHLGLRTQLQGLPWYGIAHLVWDEALLAQGALAIFALTVVFPSGDLLELGANAVSSNLQFGELEGAHIDVYLHVLEGAREAGELERYRDDEREVTRTVRRIELSSLPWLEGASDTMKLAELRKQGDGTWTLGAYVPPLVRVGAGVTPFLLGAMQARMRSLAHLETRIAAHAADVFLGGERRGELRRVAAAVYRLRAFLSDHAQQIARHPYFYFCALREFYLEACVFQNVAPSAQPAGYDHDDLAASFAAIEGQIDDTLQVTPVASPRLPFLYDEQIYTAGPFPEALVRAREVYLLVMHQGEPAPALDTIKLASPGRLKLVHLNALAGVPFQPVDTPHFSHTFGSRARFFVLERGQEWGHAVRERALCFVARPQLAGIQAALFWRG